MFEELTLSEIARSQSPLSRKFDESDRDRNRVELMIPLMPHDTVTVSFTVGYRTDDYYNSALGLHDAETWTAGVDASWTP